jgi:hypothetical protein
MTAKEMMMKAAIAAAVVELLFVTAAFGQPAAKWTPPENPAPSAILQEASADARAGKFELALAKHVWYHKHALELDQGQTGVRLSFALSYWMDLAAKHPPALVKLKEIRAATRERVTPADGREIRFEDFHDLMAINRALGEPADTAAAFQLLDEQAPEAAARVFSVAKPALIAAREYVLFAKHIKPGESVDEVVQSLNGMRQIAKDPRFAAMVELGDHAEERYVNEAATLVAILIKADRLEDAADAVVVLRKQEGDAEFLSKLAEALDRALDGEVPEQVE